MPKEELLLDLVFPLMSKMPSLCLKLGNLSFSHPHTQGAFNARTVTRVLLVWFVGFSPNVFLLNIYSNQF